ncbi:MAG: hypothetical protein AAGI46_04050 [Planctomycetota bacterium]
MADSSSSTRPSRLRRWLVRLGVLMLLLIAGLAGVGWYAKKAASSVPAFYSEARLSGADRLEAIASIERKFLNFQGDLGESTAVSLRNDSDIEPVRVSFSGEELDVYFDKWLSDSGYREPMAKYLADPRLVIHDGRLILAGRATLDGLGEVVVSIRLLPSVAESGRARLVLEDFAAGTITLPDALVSVLRQKAIDGLGMQAENERAAVEIATDGTANDAAITLAVDHQLRRLLARQPVDDIVLFPPVLGRGNVAARVVGLSVEDGVLTLDVLPLSPEEREDLVDELQAPPVEIELASVDDAVTL